MKKENKILLTLFSRRNRDKNQWGIISLSILVLFLSACESKKKEIPKQVKSPMSLQVNVNKPSINIGDLIRYTITVDAQTNVQCQMPEFAQNLGKFAIRDWERSEPTLTDDGRVEQKQIYVLETYLTGIYEIPPVKLFYIYEGKTNLISSTPICVEVTSVAEEGDLFSGIRDIKVPVEIFDVVKDNPWILPAVIFACLALIALVILIIKKYFKREKAPAPKLPAHVIAYTALRELYNKKLIEAGQIKEYYYEISNILRHYIEDRFGLRAPERTTEEFLYELNAGNSLVKSHQDLLKKFLEECDMVKFANFAADEKDAQRVHDVTVEFIEETKEKLKDKD